jgi:hypothetical protein
MSVKLFRLTTGEEILAKHETTPSGFILKDPAIIVPVGQGKLGFAKWLPYAQTEKGVEIPSNFVMFHIDPDPELVTQYTSMVSGLVVPGPAAAPQFRIAGAE